jgi:hypothetical protein
MIKKIKALLGMGDKLTDITITLTQLSDQLSNLSNQRRPTRYQEVRIDREVSDYEQVKGMFEDKYRKDAAGKYNGIKENLQECIVQYDKVLYFNRDSINYIELTAKLYELYVLRSFILEILFKTTDIESFYFYAINNNALYNTISDINHIDLDKIFLLDQEKDLDYSYYTILNMRSDRIVLVTPTEDYELENRYKKTVVRVLYSIYFEKYFLYHISNDGGDKE